jgi:hypothetical protein
MNDPNVAYTVATFCYLVHRSGTAIADTKVAAACKAVDEGANEASGKALVAVLGDVLGDGSPDAIISGLSGLFSVQADAAGGASREERVAGIRRSLFGRSTPWLAWILERGEGGLFLQCVLVEGFGEAAQLMDPNPFNDIDEQVSMAIPEFMARWELAGCRSLSLG